MIWDDWSDEDINRAMTCIVYNCHGWELTKNGTAYYHCGIDSSGYYIQEIIDFCNSPEEMWPIILENRINLNAYDDPDQGWSATTDTSFFVDSDNPLRAAAIVFLMMNGVKPE